MDAPDGVGIATYLLGGTGPPLIVLHATGFHAHCWVNVAPHLTEHFTVWAIDQRGHGASGKPEPGALNDWGVFVDDLLAVIDHLGDQVWYGVGHSLGGAVLLLAEARRPGLFRRLCCYEPVIYVPSVFEDPGGARAVSLAELARKRRAVFDSKKAALDNYASKPPFSRFDAGTLEAYVEFGLVDLPDGTVTLACRREDEASVFDGAPSTGGLPALDGVRAPVTLLGGVDPADPVSRVLDLVAGRLEHGRARRISGLDHFGPLVDPHGVGRLAVEALTAG